MTPLLLIDLSLPLKNPVIIFSVVLFIILFAPILFNRIKVPHIIGLIISGMIAGPYGFNLLSRDSSIVLFGTVGLLYIMFLAGLEIDLAEFRKNRNKIIVFGLTTFVLPLFTGTLASYYILGYGFLSSLLLASMFSTHTLVSYPIASKYGVTRNRSINMTVGGTMITDILALLILAGVAGMSKGDVSSTFWLQLGFSLIVFTTIVLFLFPIICRWFFKNFDDSISQYIFVLAMVFLASFMAEIAGVEAIIGAFFSGLVLNKFIPHSSPLMNRIDFVGNALFIPFFLISVGMLVDISVLSHGWGALKVAGVILVIALASKYLAAWITQKVFRLSPDEGLMIFGLSSSHAAATLAIILVGYNIIIGETASGQPIRLLDEDILNGTILLILVSCAVSSFVVERASEKLALLDQEESSDASYEAANQKILISLAYPDMVEDLVDFGIMLKAKHSATSLYGLHIVTDEDQKHDSATHGKKILQRAVNHASSSENVLIPLTRYDTNTSNGIIYSIKEQGITDVVIGLHQKTDHKTFLGPKVENIVKRIFETIYIYKPAQPFNTLTRIVVAVPPTGINEPGFLHWLGKLVALAKLNTMPIHFYASVQTIKVTRSLLDRKPTTVQVEFSVFDAWDDFLIFSRELKIDDFFVIVSARKSSASYLSQLEKIPGYLSNYFHEQSLMLIYPKQLESGINMGDIEQTDSALIGTLAEKLGSLSKAASYFRKKFGEK
ncbi:Kef-type K+ transport system membrane component KefB [Dyadobacter sp. BE34]|uniref:Kef-type K+ transport system membrane component KefB n=1 Tax=Dyadobacter fermentans TaxID=94254 RepID=A0ABU1R9I7_9BACT|nr:MULTISPECIES: cation:proton antiporter [Dyadobacter]MDR6809600.1 Kef-type K+ transport system membrane component KefB [Dyadobacter fermentans]MDR7047278.1 Kef-type K+ transport system membrane component KefB [Dyadobacter sp. BE242]MDR7201514.1 Kef-type K+ transport system membrane component KefB [Dyadobacter sp. BE34]MDR7219384.1 Kef-type K+ transport system membrane component KefB [Dyadobacter sp. BE31]MDR7267222.1 Kef-type K+ transport system membrane component KefB [Dyadobacter sp. BE32]